MELQWMQTSSWNGGRITQFSYHFGLLVVGPFFYFNLLLQLLSGYFLYFQTVLRRTNKMH